MADREKPTRGRKRGPKTKSAPSATDLFDTLFNQAEEPKAKQARLVVDATAKDNESDDRSAEQANSGDSRSQSPGEASDDEDPCVLMSFAGQEDNSFENSPQKDKETRAKRKVPEKIRDTSPELDDDKATSDQPAQESTETPADDAKASDAESSAEDSSQSDSKADKADGGLALGVSKDVEDDIRREIENMLANNRFRNGNKEEDDDEEPINGFISLEEDTTLVIPKINKRCRFLIRKQEDQTPPCTRDYRCSKCMFSTTRMNNMVRHYKDCLE